VLQALITASQIVVKNNDSVRVQRMNWKIRVWSPLRKVLFHLILFLVFMREVGKCAATLQVPWGRSSLNG